MFPFTKKEEEDNLPSRKAKRFLHKISRGASELQAAAAVGMDEDELRRLRRLPTFRAAVKRARQNPRTPRLIAMADLLDPNVPPPPRAGEDYIEQQGWVRFQ